MSAAEFVYTVLLKPPMLKAAANSLLLRIVPKYLKVNGVTVALNQRDPVVSGALTLGVYEPGERAFIQRTCRPGDTVLDVGANVGLYTAMTAHLAGPKGRVIALEPDPENFGYLQQTIQANSFANVHAVQAAAAGETGEATLYVSASNRGDNRMYANEMCGDQLKVKIVRLDDLLPTLQVNTLDFIKIDVQGFEGQVMEGLKETIRRSPSLVMLAEFWPDGLQRAKTNPEEYLDLLESLGLRLFELVGNKGEIRPLDSKRGIIDRNQGRKYTNIVAAKQGRQIS
jgi:FkbM family methyltransferase